MVLSVFLLLLAALLAGAPVAGAQPVDIPLSPIGDTGNAPDSATGYGEVDYGYSMGTFDITNSQYCAFLNAVATGSDAYRLYDSAMSKAGNFSGNATGAGIVRAGSVGSYRYSVLGNSGNEPVTYVSWLDAARFCNWMQNGQPATGVEDPTTTEEGAYTLDGDAYVGGTTGAEVRNAGATWWIPSEDEWYKAAYYDATLNSGLGGYWTYATQSNTTPGNTLGSGSNEANYLINTLTETQSAAYSATQDYLSPVGAFTNSASYYGTYDQDGDVFQWNEAILHYNSRGLRGGSWYGSSGILQSSGRTQGGPAGESYDIGFRVATSVAPPTIVSATVTQVTSSSVVLSVTVNPNGTDTSVSMLYGTTASYNTQSAVQDIGSGADAVTLSATLTGLTGETVYHYAVLATTAAGASAQSVDATVISGPDDSLPQNEVDEPGNSPDPLTGWGEVDYIYDIGTYDVTQAQYCSFLDAVAATDPYGLYNPQMLSTGPDAEGIVRSGSLGSYTYSIIGNSGSNPITYVTWLDAARFCNWQQNGQPVSGIEDPTTTEEGAYTLDGDMTAGNEVETANAAYWIPSEDQWYKAAYYDPTADGGSGGYWLYPTLSNSAPGNGAGSGSNEANYFASAGYSVTQSSTYSSLINYLTPVGFFANATSYYGTYDQGGDVFQWNDALVNNSTRGLRGGSWDSDGPSALQSSTHLYTSPLRANAAIGFRVASNAQLTAAPDIISTTVVSYSGTAAVLTAVVDPNGCETDVNFQYGEDTSYAQQTSVVDAGSGFGDVVVTATLTGLTPATFCYYQPVASNINDVTFGNSGSFDPTGPEVVNDYVALTGTSALTIQPLNNDSDPDDLPLTITSISQPSLGTAVLQSDGATIIYTPSINFSSFAGSDTFTYTVSNGYVTSTAQVIVSNPFYTQKGSYSAIIPSNGGYLTLTLNSSGQFTGKLRIANVSYSLTGKFDADGSYSTTLKNGDPLTLQLDLSENGGEFGQYQIAVTYNGSAFGAGQVLYNTTTNPAPFAGNYTLLIQPPAQIPLSQATASATTASGKLASITVNPAQQGAGYISVPSVAISGGSGTGGSAVALINNGKVLAINISNKGKNYPAAGATVTIAPPSGDPQGYGYATLSVTEAGAVNIAGKLADGTPFSDGVLITGGTASNAAEFQVYDGNLGYKGAAGVVGSLTGGIAFGENPGVSDCSGTLTWIKPAPAASGQPALYQAGFTAAVSAIGSRYAAPPKGGLVLGIPVESSSTTANGTVTLAQQDLLTGPASELVNIASKAGGGTAAETGTEISTTNGLQLSINASAGTFTGSFIDSVTNAKTSLAGVVFPKQDFAAGYFITSTQSGAAILSPGVTVTATTAQFEQYITLTSTSQVSIPLEDGGITAQSVVIAAPPALGTAAVAVGNASITYTPVANYRSFAGADSFTYVVSDGSGDSSATVVTISNPFYIQKGNFAGVLAGGTGGGYLSLTLATTGQFTAKLRLSGTTFNLVGSFDSEGSYLTTLSNGKTLSLQLDPTSSNGGGFAQYEIAGDYNGSSFDAWHAIYNSATAPAPETGKYNILLPAASTIDPTKPAGTGYATVTVVENGSVSIVGTMADGTLFSDGVCITGGTIPLADTFPVYVPLAYKSPGTLSGSITFEDIPGVSDCDGVLGWIKPVQASATLYPNGFTTALAAIGSRYAAPLKSTLALDLAPTSPNASVLLAEPDYPSSLYHQLSITTGANAAVDGVLVTNPGPDALTLSINATGGTFTGSFISPVTGLSTPIKGILFPKQSGAGGFSLSPTQSGDVSIWP